MYVIAHNASPVVGGGEIWNARLLAGLQERGHRVLAICRNEQVAEATRRFGVPTRIHRLGGDLMIPHAFSLTALLRREAPDVVLLTTYKKIWLGGLAARLARVPAVIVRIGRSTDGVRNWTYRYPLQHWVDAVVVNEPGLAAPFYAAARGVVPVVAITDGVPPAASESKVDVRAEIGLAPDAFLIGTVGRLSIGHKRLDRLIQTLALLPDNVHAVVVGDGPDRARCLELADAAGVRSRFHTIGFRSDVPALLRCLDVFIICSDYEGLVNAMLEALMAGVPVISTPVNGAQGALADGAGIVTGWSPPEIANAIESIRRDGALRVHMSQKASEVAHTRYSIERMIDEWELLLKTTTNKKADHTFVQSAFSINQGRDNSSGAT